MLDRDLLHAESMRMRDECQIAAFLVRHGPLYVSLAACGSHANDRREVWCRLVAEYMEAAPPTAVADVVEMLAGPPLLHMVHSRPGATAACQVLAMATAKQRKKVIKAMKGEIARVTPCNWVT